MDGEHQQQTRGQRLAQVFAADPELARATAELADLVDAAAPSIPFVPASSIGPLAQLT